MNLVPIVIARAGLDEPASRQLIASLNAELSAAYPEPGAPHFTLNGEHCLSPVTSICLGKNLTR
jgi:hypothetical protein